MTVIFGVTHVGGAVVGADRKRHNSVTGAGAGFAKKTVVLSRYAVATKAGIGPDADYIWGEVRDRIANRDVSASEAADMIEQLAPAVLEHCRSRGAPITTPLQFLVGGLTDGVPTIHAIQTNIGERTDAEGPGRPMALGMRHETNSRSLELLYGASARIEGKPMTDVGLWATELLADERIGAAHAVDYPLDLAFVSALGVEERVFQTPPPRGMMIQILAE